MEERWPGILKVFEISHFAIQKTGSQQRTTKGGGATNPKSTTQADQIEASEVTQLDYFNCGVCVSV